MKKQTLPIASQNDAEEEKDFDQLLEEFIKNELAEADKLTAEDEEDEEEEVIEEEEVEEEEEPPLSAIERLTGLHSVKEKLTRYEKLVLFNKMRLDHGLPTTPTPLHAMFLGSPGTGKTTVARQMGVMLRRAGVLSEGHVVVRERATLLGQYYSSEGENTLKAIEEAQGGILFIDEAYQLHQPEDARDPGKFVIETLLTALADESRRDWMLILAGYPDKMKRMFDMNPGLRSRIPDSNIYTFEDFTEAELIEIAERYLQSNSYTLTSGAHRALTRRLGSDYRQRDSTFGNARHVINLIQTDILPTMAARIIDGKCSDTAALSLIRASDIPAPTAHRHDGVRPKIGYHLH